MQSTRSIHLVFYAERFKDRLVDEGYNPAYGARPLRRAIMRLLEDSMAERMLSNEIKEGDSVIIDGKLHVLWAGSCSGMRVGVRCKPAALPDSNLVYSRYPAWCSQCLL